MEKVKRLFRNLSEKRSYQIVFFVVSMLGIGIFYIGSSEIIEWKKREKEIQVGERVVDRSVYAEVGLKKEENEKYIVSGWAIKKDVEIKEVYVVLESTDEKKIYRTKKCKGEDNVKYYLDDIKTKEYGFEVIIDSREIEESVCYEVSLYMCYEYQHKNGEKLTPQSKLIDIPKFIYHGELLSYNPKEFYAPQLVNQYAQIIRDGIVRDYDVENQYWVYQYESKLYYFVGKSFVEQRKEIDLRIPIMPDTSKVELLPENHRQSGRDHLGAYSLDKIYTNDNGESYYIQEIDLPTNYPITYVNTGLYDNTGKKWIIHTYIPMFDWRGYENSLYDIR